MNFIYICNSIPSVFDSQVLSLIYFIEKKCVFNKVILIVGLKNVSEKIQLESKKISKNIEIKTFKSYPNYPLIFNYLLRRNLRNTLNNLDINLKENSIFHVRGELMTWHLQKVFSVLKIDAAKVLPDIRGASLDEVSIYYKGWFKKNLKSINYIRAINSLKKIKEICTVSNCLADYVTKKSGVDKDKIKIIHSLANEKFKYDIMLRNQKRLELKLNDNDILVVFITGGSAAWQLNHCILKLACKGITVLNLSKINISHKNIINRFVNYDEVPSYLCAADAGIIWRENNIINQVASPVKFSEYACCGLPIIANDSVNIIADYIRQTNYGIILHDIDLITNEMILNMKKMDRVKISQGAIEKFSIRKIAEKYLKIYEQMYI